MIKKTLFFYASLICLVMLPSQCLAMWMLDYIPVKTLCNAASNVVYGQKQIISWDKEYFQNALDKQNYSDIMLPLYHHIDNSEINTEVCAWIKENAEAGNVAMMYLFLRNIHKSLFNKVPISKTDWQDAGKYILISFMCVYQDEMYCRKYSLNREQPQGLVELLASSSLNGGERYQRDIIKIFINKYAYWFQNYGLEKHTPFTTALQEASDWFEKFGNTLAHPIWVKYCYGTWPSNTNMISFETPHILKLKKSRVKKRDEFRTKAFSILSEMKSWLVFFTSSTNSNSQQNEDDSDSSESEEKNSLLVENNASQEDQVSDAGQDNKENIDDKT